MAELNDFLKRFQNTDNSRAEWFSLEADVQGYLKGLSEDDAVDFLDKFPYESLWMICEGFRADQDRQYYERNESQSIKVK